MEQPGILIWRAATCLSPLWFAMLETIQLRVNRFMDTLVRLHIPVLGRPRHSFHVCGLTGLALAVLLASALVLHLRLSFLVMALLIAASVTASLALAIAVKIATGRETLIYYYHELAVVAAAALVLKLAGQPLLPYLDATLLGLGTFL